MDNDVKSFEELLSRPFATVDVDSRTGLPVEGNYVSRRSYLAPGEIKILVEALRKTVANQPQDAE
jgi:hypothetical protein